ncbi:MAG: hypothetical protein Q8J78_01375 [Moraxellaceae bacterium]|nr:hypothetical protein [Moraxellaceae bacterium]
MKKSHLAATAAVLATVLLGAGGYLLLNDESAALRAAKKQYGWGGAEFDFVAIVRDRETSLCDKTADIGATSKLTGVSRNVEFCHYKRELGWTSSPAQAAIDMKRFS